MEKSKSDKDPQGDILIGHGAFGVDYVPKKRRAQVVAGRVYGGKIAELSPGKAKAIPLDRFTIALFRVDDEFYAIKDACPHAEFPLSRSSLVSRYTVMCASHNWHFDIRDGHCVKIGHCGHAAPDLTVRTFPVEIAGEEIWIVVERKPVSRDREQE
ncbi:MAG: Rieske (2Fe-2S) protein [Deltaproteobacteria bacterium]|nr:Rieske (2Fe-2S) protein [Deltaproteobacteria bacterium]